MKKKYFDEFVDELHKINSKEKMSDFLKGILTIKEREELPRRLQIVKMLREGIPQRKIAKTLGVGISTVTRGSMEMRKGRFRK